ncbi:MAG TPA: protein kinase [Acidimicrobiales bacterium]|nr:protein kinase [Acidimicrobiales bacterium]
MADIPGAPNVLDLPGVTQVEAVGRGGFATVYRGWQPAFNRAVAVKVLDHDPGGSASGRFDKEVRALGSLSGHPHVVAVYQAGALADRPYLVMPFLEGGCLEDRLRDRPVAPQAAVQIMAAIASAVGAAHHLGILHRDIKPANILFNSYGDPQLADFGIARFRDSTMTSGLVAATVTYAAPEVLGGARASEAADVYSLGATLYAALRGEPAFAPRPGEAPIAFAVRVYSEPAPDLAGCCPVPPALAAVVAKAMAKDPAARYGSAEAFRDALLGTGLNEPVTAPAQRPPGMSGPAGSAGRRPKRAAAAATALAVLIGGGVAAAAEMGGHRSTPSPVAQPADPTTTTSSPAPVTTVMPSTTVAPPTTAAPPSTPPVSSQTSTPPAAGAAPTGAGPPSAGGVATPAALPAGAITAAIDHYYALVDQHRLDTSWTWLTSAYQQRLGRSYYNSFWDGIQGVKLLSVAPAAGAASLRLRYRETSGTVSTESAEVTLAVDRGTDRILIASYRVTG